MNFNRLKISARLALGFGLTIAMGLAIAVFAILEMQQLSTDLRDVATQRMTKVQQLTVIAMNQSSMARLARNVVLRAPGSPENDADIKKIREQRAENHEMMEQLLKTVVQPKNRELLNVIVDNRVEYNSDLDQAIALAQQGQREVATKLLLGDARVIQQRMAKAAEDAIASQQESAQKLANTAATTAGYDSMILMALVAVLAAAGVSVALLITRSLTRSLGAEPNEVSLAVARVAAGDLGVEIKTRGGDEASTMAAVRRMQDELRGIVRAVRGNADSVAIASAEIAQGNTDLSSRTEQQASALQETAASMEQLGTTVKQNADNARRASQLAIGASSVAARGGEVVEKVVEAMNDITGNSSKIADIIAVIDSIAFQTNLLALNAAVEAARAGEQGRGFSVVATEVRNLAQRSASAAKDIKQLIDTSVLRVEQGAILVDRAGETMKEVVSAVQKVADIVGEISSASAEQSQGVMQVGEAIMQMDQTTQQNAALVEESAAAADSLRVQSQQLVHAVSIFKFASTEKDAAGKVAFLEAGPEPRSNKASARASKFAPRMGLNARPALAFAGAKGRGDWTSF